MPLPLTRLLGLGAAPAQSVAYPEVPTASTKVDRMVVDTSVSALAAGQQAFAACIGAVAGVSLWGLKDPAGANNWDGVFVLSVLVKAVPADWTAAHVPPAQPVAPVWTSIAQIPHNAHASHFVNQGTLEIARAALLTLSDEGRLTNVMTVISLFQANAITAANIQSMFAAMADAPGNINTPVAGSVYNTLLATCKCAPSFGNVKILRALNVNFVQQRVHNCTSMQFVKESAETFQNEPALRTLFPLEWFNGFPDEPLDFMNARTVDIPSDEVKVTAWSIARIKGVTTAYSLNRAHDRVMVARALAIDRLMNDYVAPPPLAPAAVLNVANQTWQQRKEAANVAFIASAAPAATPANAPFGANDQAKLDRLAAFIRRYTTALQAIGSPR